MIDYAADLSTLAAEPDDNGEVFGIAELYRSTRLAAAPGRPLEHQADLRKFVVHFRHWVYTCLRMNAQTLASIRLRLYVGKASRGKTVGGPRNVRAVASRVKDNLFARPSCERALADATDIEEVVSHPFLDMLRSVNPYENRFDLFQLAETYLGLTGNAYWLVEANRLGTPFQLWTLPAVWVRVIPGEGPELIAGYAYGFQHQARRFDADEVVRFHSPNPFDQLYGYPEIAAVFDAVQLDADFWTFDKAMIDNGAVPGAILNFEAGDPRDKTDLLMRQLNERYRGPAKAGKIMSVVGAKDIEILHPRIRELNHPEGRRWIRETVCAAFGVPLSLVTIEASNRAVAQAGKRQYRENTILPKCVKLEEALNQDLVPKYGDARLFVAFDNPVPEDKELRLKQRQGMIATGSTVNQQNAIDGLPPVDGGDVALVPRNLAPLTAIAAEAPQPSGRESSSLASPFATGHASKDWVVKRVAERLENPAFERALRGMYADVENDVLVRMRSTERSAEAAIYKEERVDPYEMDILRRAEGRQHRESLLEAKQYTYDDLQYWLPDPKEFAGVLHEKGRPHIERAMFRGADAALTDIPHDIGLAFDVEAPLVQDALTTYSKTFATEAATTLTERLEVVLGEGIKGGESIDKLTERVEQAMLVAKTARAKRIARTETLRAFNKGAELLYRQSKVVSKKKWLTAGDACEFCAHLNGMVVELTTAFVEVGDIVSSAIDPEEGQERRTYTNTYLAVDAAPLHPDCRCTVIPVL